jgi:hypothetical protein
MTLAGDRTHIPKIAKRKTRNGEPFGPDILSYCHEKSARSCDPQRMAEAVTPTVKRSHEK